MAGDGGYSKAWRHHVNTATAIDARVRAKNIEADLVNMQHQILMDDPMREAVSSAAKGVRQYLLSISGVNSDATLKASALDSIDEMEFALKAAVGRYD